MIARRPGRVRCPAPLVERAAIVALPLRRRRRALGGLRELQEGAARASGSRRHRQAHRTPRDHDL